MERDYYLLRAKLSSYRHLVDRTRSMIRSVFRGCKRPYVACSFGKDSLCLLHLAAQERPNIDVVWVRTDEYDEWPDTERVAREFSARFQITLHEVWAMSITECYRMTGGFYVFADTPEQKKADAAYARSFVQTITKKAKELACDCALIGLREEESKRRRILLRTRGNDFYAKKHDIREVFPLSKWTAQDVWTYIFEHDIPYPSLYDLSGEREKARNGAMFAANIQQRGSELHYAGQLAVLKRMYPELFNRFAAEFPEVRVYV